MICPRCKHEYAGYCPEASMLYDHLMLEAIQETGVENGRKVSPYKHVVIPMGWIEGGLCDPNRREDEAR